MVDGEAPGDLARLEVPLAGALEETGDRWLPFRLTDPAGAVVGPVSAFFADLLAANLKGAPFLDFAQQAEAEVNFVDDMSIQFHQPLEPRVNPDFPRQGVIYAGLVGGRIVSRVRTER